MEQKISCDLITPSDDTWEIFIQMSCEYIVHYWPDVLLKKTKEQFKEGYEKDLLVKFKKGNRGFFVLKNNHQIIGLANAYVEEEKLYLAEIYIIDKMRGKGLSDVILERVKTWGLEKGVKKFLIKVDKDFGANKFWSKLGYQLDTSGRRNVYWTEIC